jgi:2-dehydro-3-deoxyglucarate aldolase/4-hydroxy-2-oxoheptanedioate aldolase
MLNYTNHVREKIRNNEKIAAAWAQAGSNITAEIMAEAGFDMLIIDHEHGPGDIQTLISQIQALKGEKTVPFARAPWNDLVQIKRILDAGVYGLLIPYINTKDEAEQAVRATRYPTAGIRGVAGSVRAAHYGNNPSKYLETADQEIFVMIAVETYEAVENIDELISVDGVDGIFIGPTDLSSSMGYLGDPTKPQVQEAIKLVERSVIPSSSALATISGSFEDAKAKYARGYDIITLMSDTSTLSKTACDLIKQFQDLEMG